MFHCPVGVWVIGQHAIILSATVRSPTVKPKPKKVQTVCVNSENRSFINTFEQLFIDT